MAKPQDIREMRQGELRQNLDNARQELLNLRFQVETRKIKNVSRIREVKRDIARYETVLRERELLTQYGGATFEEDALPTTTAQPTTRRRGLFGLGRNR